MRICIPARENKGLESQVYGHFGSAPFFIVHDTEKQETIAIDNTDEHHEHGQCHPLAALSKNKIDAIVTGGIGLRALNRLYDDGIKVFRVTTETTAADVIESVDRNELAEITRDGACSHQHGCH